MKRLASLSLTAVVAATAVIGLAATGASPALGAVLPPAPPPSPPTPLAPQVQSLLARMQQLSVDSERYARAITAAGTVTVRSKDKHGRTRTHRKRHSFSTGERGEVSLSAASAQRFEPSGSKRPAEIVIGSTLYLYSAHAARIDGGRPWVRLNSGGVILATSLFPYHGGERLERNLGANGPYAGLVNLLSTADGAVTTSGPVTVAGQPTTELTATVRPAQLLALTARELTIVAPLLMPEQLHVFVTEAGLPLRVAVARDTATEHFSDTVTLLATNTPVHVKAPPRRRTIGQAALTRLERRRGKAGSSLGESTFVRVSTG